MIRRGARPIATHAISGVQITSVSVKKALFVADVVSSPTVCKSYPSHKKKPNATPRHTIARQPPRP